MQHYPRMLYKPDFHRETNPLAYVIVQGREEEYRLGPGYFFDPDLTQPANVAPRVLQPPQTPPEPVEEVAVIPQMSTPVITATEAITPIDLTSLDTEDVPATVADVVDEPVSEDPELAAFLNAGAGKAQRKKR